MTTGTRFLPCLLAVLAVACGDRVVGTDYPGEPLATLKGQIVLPAPMEVPAERLRLAVAWYPQWMAADDTAAPEGPPQQILSDDFPFTGTFPANYQFHLFAPPAPSALAPLGEGLNGKGAFGVLFVYQDRNRNDRLDVILSNGAPVDRVLGSSLLEPGAQAFALVYVESAQPAATGLKPGINLVRDVGGAGQVVPLDSPMVLSMTPGGALYDALLCEAGWLTFLITPVCGLEPPPEPKALYVDGFVGLNVSRAEVSLEITDEDQVEVTDAVVKVNGREIPYDAQAGQYVLSEPNSSLIAPGSTVTVSATTGGARFAPQNFPVPGAFEIVSPAPGEKVAPGGDFFISWTAAENATAYYAGFDATMAGGSMEVPAPELRTGSGAFDTTWASGPAIAYVEARIQPVDITAFVRVYVRRERTFSFGN